MSRLKECVTVRAADIQFPVRQFNCSTRSGHRCIKTRNRCFIKLQILKRRLDSSLSILAKLGRKARKATAQKLTAEQRKASARKAAKARWAKPKPKPGV
jgi:hypothetical protein